jgi:capsular exopolysaccharide synthesis family protein
VSRIDEALRRTEKIGPDRPAGGNQDVFVSAWALDPAPASPRSDVHRNGHAPHPPEPLPISHQRPISLSGAFREQLANTPEANPVLVEQFRKLAATLHHAQTGNGIRVIMLTSAAPDEGKTLTALNLALVLSESYRRRVLLIDADLRRPSLANIADVTAAPGLSEALRYPAEQKLGILQVTPLLMLLPAGRPDPDPVGGLTSPRMRNILDEAAGRFDWVILDAPPMGPMADANLLASMVDGAVFVVRAGHTHYQAAQRAIEALGRERVLGVVLNGVESLPHEHYEYYSASSKEGGALTRS